MSGKAVRLHPAAVEEAEAATDWYRQRSIRAAEMFLDELDYAVSRIEKDAGQFPEHLLGARWLVRRRFLPLLNGFLRNDSSRQCQMALIICLAESDTEMHASR